MLAGLGVGFISSLFGVGGGVVLVPTFLYFSDLPAHAISATSHFGIVLTSPVGLVTHWLQHDIAWGYGRAAGPGRAAGRSDRRAALPAPKVGPPL